MIAETGTTKVKKALERINKYFLEGGDENGCHKGFACR